MSSCVAMVLSLNLIVVAQNSGAQSRTPKRVEKPVFMSLLNKKWNLPPAYWSLILDLVMWSVWEERMDWTLDTIKMVL